MFQIRAVNKYSVLCLGMLGNSDFDLLGLVVRALDTYRDFNSYDQ